MKELIVISLGGSVLVPDKIDSNFLKEFSILLRKYFSKFKFILVVGGGKTAREYVNSASEVISISNEAKDWIGIKATRLNAEVVRAVFSAKAVVSDPTKKESFDNILIAAGWKPGFSTDFDAVILAKTFGSKTVVNMTNVDYLYNKNPREHKDAKKIKSINWKGFLDIVGDKFIPGMNTPFDPIASKEASKLGIKLILIGKNLKNFSNLLEGKEFEGSIVQ